MYVAQNDFISLILLQDQDLINKLQLSNVTLKLENSKLQQEHDSRHPLTTSHDHDHRFVLPCMYMYMHVSV